MAFWLLTNERDPWSNTQAAASCLQLQLRRAVQHNNTLHRSIFVDDTVHLLTCAFFG